MLSSAKKSQARLLLLLNLLLVVASSDGPTYNQTLDGTISGDGGLTTTQKQVILALHNHYRSNVYPSAANMQKLLWDDTLENITSNYVEKCRLAHNKQRHQLYDRAVGDHPSKNQQQQRVWVGENIAWGSGTCTKPNGTSFQCGDVFEGIKRWLQQSTKYNYDRNDCAGKCSLYTQMIWAETDKMACAAKKCPDDKTILICNYVPGGNIPGSRPYLKGASCSKCSEWFPKCEKALCVEDHTHTAAASKKLEIIKSTVVQPAQLYDCQDQTYVFTSTTSTINMDSYNDNPTPLQFEIPFNGDNPVDKYILCFDILWAITKNNSLLARYIKKYSDWARMTVTEPVETVSCVSTQVIWLLTVKGNIFVRHLSEISKMNNTDWWKLPNGIKLFRSLSCVEGACWGITNNNETFTRSNINKENPFGDYWKPDPIQLQAIVSNKQNAIIGTTLENKFKYKLPSDGDQWEDLNRTSLNNVAFCLDGVVELIPNNRTFKKIPNDEFFVTKNKPKKPKPSSGTGGVSIVTNTEDIALFNKLPFDSETPAVKSPENNVNSDQANQATATNLLSAESEPLKKHNIDLFDEKSTQKSDPIPEVKPIIPPLHQFTPSTSNDDTSSDLHFVDGFKGFASIPIKSVNPNNWDSPVCCSLADSVCPDLSKGCDAYIVCHGYNPVSKRCDIGNVFDPTLNICVPKDQTHFFCDTPSVPRIFKPDTIPSTFSPAYSSVKIYTPNNAFEPSQVALNIAPSLEAAASAQPRSPEPKPPMISEISNDVKWSDFDVNPHNYYIQPRVSIEKEESNFGVLREAWFNLGTSSSLDFLYNNSRYPDSPDEFLILDSFEAPPNAGDGYGQRLTTYFRPNISGKYTFFMSCDNECELRLSEDHTENLLHTVISLRKGHYSGFRQTDKYADLQKSTPIPLKSNKIYLLQATMKEGTIMDHISVSIEYPNGAIDRPARYNLLLVPEWSNLAKSYKPDKSKWNSDIGKKTLVANKHLKRNKIHKPHS